MQAAQVKAYEVITTLYMAMELSNSKWKLGFGNGTKIRRQSIDARDRQGCLEEVALAKDKLKLPADAPVVFCFEAGRDGHWSPYGKRRRSIRRVGISIVTAGDVPSPQKHQNIAPTFKPKAKKLVSMGQQWVEPRLS